jgi:predicted nuclease of restriction endonuclease-like (RecB) superfamily
MIKKITTQLKKNTKGIDETEYARTLLYLKKQIQEAQTRAILAVNRELIRLYWLIGKTIVEQQEKNNWGTKAVETLAQDLQNTFPGIGGFSRASVFKMRAFYMAYEKVSQAVRQFEELPIFNVPWGHNVILITKLKDHDQRLWYAQKAIEHGWSRSMLELWIESDLYKRQGKAITNFKSTLPVPDSDMAQQTLKDPYLFNFLTLHEDHLERDVEQGLVAHIQKFLLELGEGFAFIGRQYHLEISGNDYYIDLLFYHLKLRCYVVVELKNTEFKPEYAGKLNFYLSAVDDLLRHPDDKPTIGLLLCKTKDNFTAEYALRNISSPIGVSQYTIKLTDKLSKELKSSLPTIEEIEAELEKHTITEEF